MCTTCGCGKRNKSHPDYGKGKKSLSALRKDLVGFAKADSKSKDCPNCGKKDKGPCWENYRQDGMKIGRKGTLVPNCIPKKKVAKSYLDVNGPNAGIARSLSAMSADEVAGLRAGLSRQSAARKQKNIPVGPLKKPFDASKRPNEVAEQYRNRSRVKRTAAREARLLQEAEAAKNPVVPETLKRAKFGPTRGQLMKIGLGTGMAAGSLVALKHRRDNVNKSWQTSEGKNPKGGLNEKGRRSYERENPGSNLKPPVKSGNNPRRASFLARMGGMPGPEYKPNGEPTRLLLSLRAWGASSKDDAKKKAAAISKASEAIDAGLGATAGLGTAMALRTGGGWAAKRSIEGYRKKKWDNKKHNPIWSDHRKKYGVDQAKSGKVPLAFFENYPKELPGGKAQRMLAFKNRPAVAAATLGGSAALGGLAASRKKRKDV